MTSDAIAFGCEVLQSKQFKDSNILNLLPIAVYVCDKDGRIVNFNQKAAELWGRTPEKGDRAESFFSSHKIHDGNNLPQNQTAVADYLHNGSSHQDVEVIIERPDHSQRTVKCNIVPIKDENDTLCGMINSFYDITQEKKAQKELDSKTSQLQDYVDNAAPGLHWVDGNGIIIWANRAELDMLGYSEEEYIGHHISEFHAEQRKIDDIMQRLTCNERLDQYESELRCKDGSVKTVHISSNVLWDQGKFIHTRCFTADVTRQKEISNALKESQSQARQLIEIIQAAIYTTDTEGRITMFNRAAAALWGRDPEIGEDMWCGSYKIFNADGSEMPPDRCPMAVCLKEKRPVHGEEILVMRPDGSLRNVAPHPQPLVDENGKMTGAVNMLIDITHTKLTENALRESKRKYKELTISLEKMIEEKTADLKLKNQQLERSEERYHKMIEEIEDYAIILLNKKGIVQNWNKGAEKIKGYKEKEIVGKSFSTFYLPEDRNAHLPEKILQEAGSKGKALYEGWRLRKDGSHFWGSIVLTALHDDKNNIIGFSKVTRDLTQIKVAQDKMQEYTSQLEFKNKELEQFAYAASHDMKEPLRKIRFYVSAVAENLEGVLDSRAADFLQRALGAATRMSKLIEDLLSYATTNGSQENFQPIDLNKVVDEIVLQHKSEFEDNTVSIEAEGLGTINGIPFQIKQLLDNLVTNSVKYKHPERNCVIKLREERVSAAQVKVEGANKYNRYCHLSVSDNGVGFDAEHSQKIFDIFQRLSNSVNTTGSGIGLAICKRIVENHHGYIKATGKKNKGARFDIFLPLNGI